jgi:hypothetical protein
MPIHQAGLGKRHCQVGGDELVSGAAMWARMREWAQRFSSEASGRSQKAGDGLADVAISRPDESRRDSRSVVGMVADPDVVVADRAMPVS